MSYAYRCEVCDGDPLWTITREGDVVVSWVCAADLSTVCERLQRDHEVTRLIVKHYAKSLEHAEITRMIRDGFDNA